MKYHRGTVYEHNTLICELIHLLSSNLQGTDGNVSD